MSRNAIPALLFLAAGMPALAQPMYQVTAIPPPPTGTQMWGRAVNNYGHVTGSCQIGGITHAFIYTPTAGSSDIASMGFNNPQYGGYAINDFDEVVGQYPIASRLHAFRWAGSLQDITINITSQPSAAGYAAVINAAGVIGGTLTANCNPVATPLSAARWAPGGGSVVAYGDYDLCSQCEVHGINNAGDLVGWGQKIYGGFDWFRPTLWHAGAMIELPTFGSSPGHGYAESINDLGFVVGTAENRDVGNTSSAPCRWAPDGTITSLNPAADPFRIGDAKAINNSGLIVGVSGQTPVIWTAPGTMFALLGRITPTPAITISDAVSLSDSGFIVCNGSVTGQGTLRAFLLSPCTPYVMTGPAPVSASAGTLASFSVTAVGAGPLSYQWRKDGVALADGTALGGEVTAGATTSTLVLSPATCHSAGGYDCIITSPCGTATSTPALLTVLHCHCVADFNNDGDLGTDADIEAFFRCLAGACCPACALADFDGNGDVGTDADLEAFFRVLGGGPC